MTNTNNYSCILTENEIRSGNPFHQQNIFFASQNACSLSQFVILLHFPPFILYFRHGIRSPRNLISLGAALSHLSAVNKEALCRCVHPSISILTGTSPPSSDLESERRRFAFLCIKSEGGGALSSNPWVRVGWRQSAIAGDQYVVRALSDSHLFPSHRAKI